LQEARAFKVVPIGFPRVLEDRNGTVASRNLFSALFFSKAGLPLDSVKKLFEEHGVELHAAHTAVDVDQWVRGRRLDLVLCDYDAPGVPQLACLQRDTRWRGISMVIVGGQQFPNIRDKRIHFTVSKPFTPEVLAKGLRAAYTTMARQRFSAYRHVLALRPIAGTLLYRGSQRPLTYTSIANVSQTGLCLAGPEPLPEGGVVSLNFTLPDSNEVLNVAGPVIWSDASGKSGICFQRLTPQQQKQLQDRLKSRLPWKVDYLFPPE
jgi:CheY-like chemotaxis protein